MKHIFSVLAISLLVGCSSTKSIDGKYDLDKEYTAQGYADAIESVDGLNIPKDQFIEQYLEDLKARHYEVEVEFPQLRVTISYPDKPTKTVIFNLKKVDDNRYISTKDNNPQEVEFTYDPSAGTFSSVTTKYIKR